MSGKAKRARERARNAEAAAAPVVEGPTPAQRAELVFQTVRRDLFGEDKAMWRLREPAFAFAFEHVVALQEWLRAGLANRGVALPAHVDPIVVAGQMVAHGIEVDAPTSSIIRV